MIARLKGLASIGGAGRSAELVRPAIVLGAVAVVSLGVALFGGGESSAATDSSVGESVGAESTAEATDGHGAEPADEEADGHDAEPTAEATAEHDAESTAEHDTEPTAEATDEHDAELMVEPTVEATSTVTPTFTLGVTATPSASEVRWTDFISGEFDVLFKYEVAPSGFVLDQLRTPDDERRMRWTLTRQSDDGSNSGSGAAPRGMSIEVYVPNPFPADAEAWVRGSSYSHFGAASGAPKQVTVGGAQGVLYTWSGADEALSAVVQFDGRIWVFTSTYRELSVGAFDVLLNSVVFWK